MKILLLTGDAGEAQEIYYAKYRLEEEGWTVDIATTTKFGTAARPFTRSQLVPGAVVYARLRHQTDGTVTATVIASATADTPSASATASTGA